MSGSVTISSSGVPARLRSMPVLPWKSSCSDLPASSSRWARVRRTTFSCACRPGRPDSVMLPPTTTGSLVLADLVALGQVGVEVVLAREDRLRRDLAPTARPNWMARRPLRGSAPAARRAGRGRPRRPGCWARRRRRCSAGEDLGLRVEVGRGFRGRSRLPTVHRFSPSCNSGLSSASTMIGQR